MRSGARRRICAQTTNGDQRGAGRRLLIPETRVQTDKNAPVDFLLMQRSPGEWRESRRGRGAFPPAAKSHSPATRKKGARVRQGRSRVGFLFAPNTVCELLNRSESEIRGKRICFLFKTESLINASDWRNFGRFPRFVLCQRNYVRLTYQRIIVICIDSLIV